MFSDMLPFLGMCAFLAAAAAYGLFFSGPQDPKQGGGINM